MIAKGLCCLAPHIVVLTRDLFWWCGQIKYHANGADKDPIEIDFSPPWPRIPIVTELERILGVTMPKDLASDEAREFLDKLCVAKEVQCSSPRTAARLLDKLVGDFIEIDCKNPTFLIDHPEVMSPLAKSHRSSPFMTERFELFVAFHELCNAYTELNMPAVQRERFLGQMAAKKSGDDEAQEHDEGYCVSLEYGLPPTAGWGMGIDRLVMLMADRNNIKEVKQHRPRLRAEGTLGLLITKTLCCCFIMMTTGVAVPSHEAR